MMMIHMLSTQSLEAVRKAADGRLNQTESFKEALKLQKTIYGLDKKIVQEMKKSLA